MAKKCRHKNGVILAFANYVEFKPDQEPFKAGVIEPSGLESITVESISIYYCPKCKVAQSVEVEGDIGEIAL